MAYEPVLAPSVVTGDSPLTPEGESGFRHYLKISASATPPSVTPATPKSINTAFIIPQSEALNEQLSSSVEVGRSKKVFSWWNEATASDITSFTDPSSSETMTTTTALPSTVTTNTESGISSSPYSSPFESPRSASLEHGEEEMVELRNNHEHPTSFRTRSQINISTTRAGSNLGSWFQKLFRRKGSATDKTFENNTSASESNENTFVSSRTSLAKEPHSPPVEHRLSPRVIEMRSTEVFAAGPYSTASDTAVHNWAPSVTRICDPTKTAPLLNTTCLQITSGEPDVVPKPSPTISHPPLLLHIGKVETTSLPSTPRFCGGTDSGIGQRTSVISVFADLSPRVVSWEDKSTSPFTIPPLEETMPKRGAIEIEEPNYSYREDSDPTRLSTQLDLESDTSLQQSDESFYETICKKSSFKTIPSTQPPPGCCSDSSECTLTQNRPEKGVWDDDENSSDWLTVAKKSTTKVCPEAVPSSTPDFYLRQGGGGSITPSTPDDERHLATSNTPTNLKIRRSKNTPPAIFRRNRDIANGIQSPISPSSNARRMFSLGEAGSPDQVIETPPTRAFSQRAPTTNFQTDYEMPHYPPPSLLRDVDSTTTTTTVTEDGTSGIVDDHSIIVPNVIPQVSAVNVTSSENTDLTKIPQNTSKTLPEKSSEETPSTPALPLQNGTCISPAVESKPIAKVLPHLPSSEETDLKTTQPEDTVVLRKKDSVISSVSFSSSSKISDASTTLKVDGDVSLLMKIEKEPEKPDLGSTRSSIVSDVGSIQIVSPTVSRPQSLELIDSNNSSQQPSLKGDSTKPSPATETMVAVVSPSPVVPTPSKVETKSEDLEKMSPKPPILSIPDPEKTPVARTRSQVTPTSPLGQHFFPKTPQKVIQTHVGSQLSTLNENKTGTSPMTNGWMDATPTPTPTNTPSGKSTKIRRSMHVTKRPQTDSVSRSHLNGSEIFITNPNTHKNISPEEHFTMHEEIGKGKFGNVFRCEQKQTHQILAAKKIKSTRLVRHESGDFMEVAVLRAIGHHANIACLHSAYEVGGTCVIITEYVSGGALFDRIVEEDNLDEKISASIIRQMLLGLQYIQSCSVLHLDLKPENVMMVAPSGYQLKIIDFGLAYFYDPKKPRRQMGGTITYSAPETINFEFQSFATDIWSVGVIAYELLSGITPFECPQSGNLDRELTLSEITDNIINCRYNFDDDGICDASETAKDFIRLILKKSLSQRPSVKQCLEHPWMQMSDELPTVRRAVSIRRRASALEKTRPFELGQVNIKTDNEVY